MYKLRMEVNYENHMAAKRMEKGFTQLQLASMSGFSLSSIQSWEVGRKVPSIKGAIAIGRCLGLGIEEIFPAIEGRKDEQ